MKKYQGEND